MAKWIKNDKDKFMVFHTCSNCGQRALEKLVWIDEVEEVLSPFCPFCGKSMQTNKESRGK